jgi:hypothetical protein
MDALRELLEQLRARCLSPEELERERRIDEMWASRGLEGALLSLEEQHLRRERGRSRTEAEQKRVRQELVEQLRAESPLCESERTELRLESLVR